MAKQDTLFDESKLPVGTVAVEADLSEAVADEAPEQAAEEPAPEAEAAPETTETPNEGEQATATETTEEAEAPAEEAVATEEEAPAETVDGEVAATEEKPAETVAEKPVEAAKPAVDPELQQAAQWAQQANALMNEDAEYRVAHLKALKRKNMLPQQGEVELAGLETLLKTRAESNAPAQAAPQKSEAEVAAEMRKLFAQGKELEAMKVYRAHDPVAQEVAALKAKQDAAEKERQAEAQKREWQATRSRAVQQISELAKMHPDLLEVNADGCANFKDKAFADELRKAARGLSADVPLAEVAKFALFKMGRLQAPATSKTVSKTVAATKPPITSAPRPGVAKPKAPPLGEVTVDFTVE